MTAFGEAVDKWYEVLVPGKVYLISNAQCKMSKRQFSNVNNEYEIHLEPTSIIQLAKSDDPSNAKLPSIRYCFVPISDIAGADKDRFVDVIAVISECSDCQSLTAKASGRQLEKRDLTLVDQSSTAIKLTLWGQEAVSFHPKTSTMVLAVKGAKVGEYQGGKTMSTVSTSTVTLDPDIPEAHRLRGWFDAQGALGTVQNLSLTSAAGTPSSESRKTLAQAKSENLGHAPDRADYFTCSAHLTFLKAEGGPLWYEACPQEGCAKKVINEGPGQYRCERCQRMWDRCDRRYIITGQIADHSDSAWISIFNDQGAALLGKTADEMHSLKEAGTGDFEKTLRLPLHKQFAFRIRAKAESYQGEERVRLNVVAVQPIDPVQDGLMMSDELRKVL